MPTPPLSTEFRVRQARLEEKPILQLLVAASVRELSREEYSTEQIAAALQTVFGVDSELIQDGTYFVVETNTNNLDSDNSDNSDNNNINQPAIVACGGWSRRKTLFGGDQFAARESQLLDPQHDAAKIRAFFVHPDWARRGIGTLLLAHCEHAAKAHGFSTLELMGTLPGVKLYREHGFIAGTQVMHDAGNGVMIPFVPMTKQLDA
jgi:ribosomal protein S18 acetylase RimI-like enzyme